MRSSDPKNLAEVLLETTDGKPEAEQHKALKDFAAYLSRKGELRQADAIIEEYRKLYNEKHAIIEATVTLVSRLPEKTKLELRETLKKRYKAREVHILEKVDQRILGGMKIKIGDTVYDGTLQNSLSQLQTALLK